MTTTLTDDRISVFLEWLAGEPRFDGARVHVHPDDFEAALSEVRESRSALSREREARERAEARLKNYEDGQMCCPRAERAEAALRRMTDGADRIGGDRDGMPECPWCHADGDGTRHEADCDLLAARAALAGPSGEGAKGGSDASR